ncbi:NlpC/P60 family protein [Veronia nyctiphanis]|uniref:NlpC/P60 family protein n=1 Tax=Veronia nyctiphanis TaxID=1278244 RepID=UPI00191C3C40|nr:NlpC/P60 family protein [Veronia nyctiphanis]
MGCSQTAFVEKNASTKKSEAFYPLPEFAAPPTAEKIQTRLEYLFNEWKGTPYNGGNSKRGIDCSAFTQISYRQLFKMHLPRTTKYQVSYGKQVALSEIDTGDLVFFKTRRNGYHVGIYMGGNSFVHASTSKGVTISKLDSPYWTRVFWQVRRYF